MIFSRGASSNLMSPYGLGQDEGCELTRISLTKHEAEVSRIVRLSMLFLKKNSPSLRLIVSFADPQYGHHGGIYQAGNWIYSGDTALALSIGIIQKDYIVGKFLKRVGTYNKGNKEKP